MAHSEGNALFDCRPHPAVLRAAFFVEARFLKAFTIFAWIALNLGALALAWAGASCFSASDLCLALGTHMLYRHFRIIKSQGCAG